MLRAITVGVGAFLALMAMHDNKSTTGTFDLIAILTSEHRGIKWIGWSFIVLGAGGGWVGVWSLVFWNRRLGSWRWLISALGWSALLVGVFQGLSLITAF